MLHGVVIPEGIANWNTQSLIEFLDFNLNKKRIRDGENGEVIIEEDEPIFTKEMKDAFEQNKINGGNFVDLGVDDLKELLFLDQDTSSEILQKQRRALVGMKLLINKLNTKTESSLIIDNLSSMYQVLNDKFLAYQNQYNKLRLDVLEIIRTTNNVAPTLEHSVSTPNVHRSGSVDKFNKHNDIQGQHANSQPTLVQKASTYSLGQATIANGSSNNSSSNPELNSEAQAGEPLKQLRASKEDSCEKVLKNAMRKHNLQDQDWRSYVLVICYGDQERILSNDEKPVTIFKSLKKSGLHPAIMLRQKDDMQLDSNTPGGRL
ncbi:hypothetical protein ACO0QE_002266 [Hanseniaspora vineae]